MNQSKSFPILTESVQREYRYRDLFKDCPKSIPWEILASHEKQALKNHSKQSLEKLASRGGLSCREILAIISDKDFYDLFPPDVWNEEHVLETIQSSIRIINSLIIAYNITRK